MAHTWNHDRDAEIVRLHGEGLTYADLGRRFDLSPYRIGNIVRLQKARALSSGKTPEPFDKSYHPRIINALLNAMVIVLTDGQVEKKESKSYLPGFKLRLDDLTDEQLRAVADCTSVSELLSVPNFGPSAAKVLKGYMASRGFTLRD